MGRQTIFLYKGAFFLVLLMAIGLTGAKGQTLIRDWYDLDQVRHNLNKQFRLVKDLDKHTPGYQQIAGPQANGGKGFDPIDSTYQSGGVQYHLPFTGFFNGNGHTIKDLHINRPNADYTALFGYIRGATIQKLGVEGVNITGLDHVAGLVGQVGTAKGGLRFSSIQQCFTSGKLTVKDSLGGGLIGEIAANTTDVTRCYSHAQVAGGQKSGGLIGSMATGRGGFFQVYQPYISKAYATGSISGSQNTGGLVGFLAASPFNTTPNVQNLFNVCFWDRQQTQQKGNGASNLTNPISDLTGLPTPKLKKLNTFSASGWQVDEPAQLNPRFDYWQMIDRTTYPYLRWETIAYRTTSQGANNWHNQGRWEVFDNRKNWVQAKRIPGKSGLSFTVIIRHDITIQNQNQITIGGRLNLRNGVVTNKGGLTLQSNAEVRGGNNNSFVDGSLKIKGEGEKYFPVGDGGHFAPVRLNLNAYWGFWQNPYATVSYQKQSYQPQKIKANSPLEAVSHQEHWRLTVNDSRADVSLFWKDAGFSSIQNTRFLRMARWNGSQWQSAGRDTLTTQGNQGMIRVNNLQNFGRFTFASTNAQKAPLPVELMYFKAQATSEQKVALRWETASETNNSHFLVQRRTADHNWQQIDSVPGHGTSVIPHRYTSTDAHPKDGYNYYRLKQVDRDGSYEYHGVKAVRLESKASKGLTARVLGNPVKGHNLRVKLSGKQEKPVRFRLTNLKGKMVRQGSWTLHGKAHIYTLPMHSLPKGAYLLHLSTGDQQLTRKILY